MNLVMLVPLNSSSSVSRTKYFWVAAPRSKTDKQSAKANDCNCDLLQQIKLMNFPGNSSMSMLKGKRQRHGGKKGKIRQREKWIQLVITIKTTADVRHEIAKEKGFTQRRRVQNIPAPTSDAKCVFVHGSHAKCKYCIHWCYYCGTFDYSAWINIDHAPEKRMIIFMADSVWHWWCYCWKVLCHRWPIEIARASFSAFHCTTQQMMSVFYFFFVFTDTAYNSENSKDEMITGN